MTFQATSADIPPDQPPVLAGVTSSDDPQSTKRDVNWLASLALPATCKLPPIDPNRRGNELGRVGRHPTGFGRRLPTRFVCCTDCHNATRAGLVSTSRPGDRHAGLCRLPSLIREHRLRLGRSPRTGLVRALFGGPNRGAESILRELNRVAATGGEKASRDLPFFRFTTSQATVKLDRCSRLFLDQKGRGRQAGRTRSGRRMNLLPCAAVPARASFSRSVV